jgi:hypothetical protein
MAAYDIDSTTLDKRPSAATGGWRSLLSNKLLLSLLGVSLIPLALMGIATYRSAAAALTSEAFGKMETVRTITAKSVERYFQTLHDELRVLSEDRMTIDACKQFQAAFATVLTDNKTDDKAMARARRELESHYGGDFAAEFRKQTGDEPGTKAQVESLDDTAAYLQFLYIRNSRVFVRCRSSGYNLTEFHVVGFLRRFLLNRQKFMDFSAFNKTFSGIDPQSFYLWVFHRNRLNIRIPAFGRHPYMRRITTAFEKDRLKVQSSFEKNVALVCRI